MGIEYIQGFDFYETTSDPAVPYLTADNVEKLLGFRAPANSSSWFIDSSGSETGPEISTTEVRINGRSLKLDRQDQGSTYNPQWNGAKHLDFTRTFSQTQKACVGFATYIDTAPTTPIPIVQVLYDNGTSEAEQASLWLGPTGVLYLSSDNLNLSDDTAQSSTIITGASSGTGAFRFGRFVYVEMWVDYTVSIPTIVVHVNGTEVINKASSACQKVAGGYITGLSIINPHNQYWSGDAFTQYLDDIYYSTDNAILGPQHIVALEPTADSTKEWTASVGSDNYQILNDEIDPSALSNYVSNTGTDQDIYDLQNPAVDVVAISAVAVTGLASIDTGTGNVRFTIHEGATEEFVSVTVDSSLPEFKQAIFEDNADDDAWTNALVTSMQMGIRIS